MTPISSGEITGMAHSRTSLKMSVSQTKVSVGTPVSLIMTTTVGAISTSSMAMLMAHRKPIVTVSITTKTDNLLTAPMHSTSLLMPSHAAQPRAILITMMMLISMSSIIPAIRSFKTILILALRDAASTLSIDASKLG